MLTQKYNLQSLDISSDWVIVRNMFYDIDPKGILSEEDKEVFIYCQQDLLYLTKGKYHLDLGWYGYNNLENDNTGYCIHLFRGNNWNDSELLEKIRSREKEDIVARINQLMKAVDDGVFDKLIGYRVDENDPANKNDFSKINTFSVRA